MNISIKDLIAKRVLPYQDEVTERYPMQMHLVDGQAGPDIKVAVSTIHPTHTGQTATWCCEECGVGDRVPTTVMARACATHHALECGTDRSVVDHPAYRDLLAEAAGTEYLVRLPVTGNPGGDVTIRHRSGLADVEAHCSACGDNWSHFSEPLTHAWAGVHAAHCGYAGRGVSPEYLDLLENVVEYRIKQRITEATEQAVTKAEAPLQDQIKELDAEVKTLTAERDQVASRSKRQRLALIIALPLTAITATANIIAAVVMFT